MLTNPTQPRSPYEQLMKPKPTSPTSFAPTQPQVAQEGPGMMPKPTSITSTAPKPATTMAPAPAGSTVTRTASTVPGAYAPQPGQPFTDLRSRVFAPTQSAGTAGIGSQVSQLAQQLGGQQFQPFQGIGGGSYSPSGDTGDVRQQIMEQLQRSLSGPDRAGLAAQAFDLMRTRSDPAYQQTLRGVGQKNAALGRIGSGMVTNELMDVTAQRERDLSLAQRDLALEAAGLTQQDRLQRLGAAQGVFDQFSGADRADTGLGIDLRNEARGERQAGLNYGLDKFSAQHGLLNTLGGLEQQRFNQDLTGRNEMRSERDFQQGQSQQAIDNALRQRLSEETIFGNDYDRWLRGTSTFGQLGFGNDPSGAYLAGAGQYGQQAQAGMDSLGQLGQNWSYTDWLRRQGAIVN